MGCVQRKYSDCSPPQGRKRLKKEKGWGEGKDCWGGMIAGDEMVEGWPKWLVDNIPREVLAGLVSKSADSYDKFAKIGQGTYSNVRRNSKSKRSSQMKCEGQTKDMLIERDKGDTESSTEDKRTEKGAQGQETSNSTSSRSSSFNPFKLVQNHTASLSPSPIKRSTPQRSLKTGGHPNATKNIQNFTLLQASITDIINFNRDNPHY
ncbi:hypothetical protein SLE2022_298740 [Rubroshorea leprosula]